MPQDIITRIQTAKHMAVLASGNDPVGLLVGTAQMLEMAEVFGGMPTEYDGMTISVQPGVDGVVIITQDRFPVLERVNGVTVSVKHRYVGVHPILF